jgi:hypothetical protein
MRPMTKATAAAAAALLLLGVTACGDDDDEATTDTTEASTDDTSAPAGADTPAFCDGLVEFNGAVTNIDLGEESTEDDIKSAGDELAATFAPVVENAPDSVAEAAADIEGVLEQMQGGDGEAFDSDETFETYSEIVDGGVEACEFESVGVTAVDYAFEDVPESIPAGTVVFDLTNASEAEEHEMIVFSKADGVDLTFQEILELPEEESESMVEFAGAAFAPPGGQSTALATLEPGQYGMVCFIPVGGGEDGPPHFAQGMFKEFTVE